MRLSTGGAEEPRIPQEARSIILIGLLESFSANFATMASFIWLTSDYLPRTNLVPSATSTAFMAICGLSMFLVARRVGATVDRYKPHGLFMSTQALNIAVLPAIGAVIHWSDPRRPGLTLGALYILDVIISARTSTYTSATNVFISHVVPEKLRTRYYSLEFKYGLIAVFSAPILAAQAVQRSVYLGLGVASMFCVISLVVLSTPRYRRLEQLHFGARVSWNVARVRPNLSRIFRRRECGASPQAGSRGSLDRGPRGLTSLRSVRYVGVMITLMTVEALGNRARESFDIYFVTQTLGRTTGDIGVLATSLSAGLALGAVLVGWTRSRISWSWWPSACYVMFGVCFAAKGIMQSWSLVLLASAGEGLFLGLLSGLFQAAKVQYTPPELMGRVSAAFGAVFQGVSTIGLGVWATYAWLATRINSDFMPHFGYRIAYVAGGSLIMCAGMLSARLYAHVDWRQGVQ